jgi:hypothetical protein
MKLSKEIALKNIGIRNIHWPDVTDDMLWSTKKHDGWTIIPRTMPVIFKIMDELAGKGKPVSSVYFAIWCRAREEHVIKLNDLADFIKDSGFTGIRAKYTWKERMQKLIDLEFIKAVDDGNKNFSWLLLLDPYDVIESKKTMISKGLYDYFQTRLLEVGHKTRRKRME